MQEAQEQKKPAGRGRGRAGPKPKPEAEVEEKTERPQTAQKSQGRGRGSKKAVEPAEESKAERPQTAKDGSRGRGQRGGRGNNRGGRQDRGEEEGDEEKPKREKRGQDPNSWISKFHNEAERKKYDMNIEITSETQAPALPEKEDIIKNEPQKKELETQLNNLEAEAKKIQNKKEALIKKKQVFREGGTIGKGNTTMGGQLKNLIQEQKDLTKEKRVIQDQMNGFQNQIDELEGKKAKLTQNMMKGFHSLEDITAEIEDKKKRMTTCTITPAEEREIVRDLQKLQNSLPQAQELVEITPAIKELKAQKNALFGGLKAKRPLIDAKSKEIDKLKAVMDSNRSDQNEERDQLDKMGEEIGACNEEMQAIFKQKDEAKEAYWKARFAYREQQDLINYVNFINNTKKAAVELEAEYAAERSKIANEPVRSVNLMKDEIKTCDFLIGLCDSQLKRAGLRQESAAVAAKLQKEEQQQAIEKKREEMIKANKLEVGLTKQQREAESSMIQGNKKKKNKGRQHQQQAEEVPKDVSMEVDLVIVQKYSSIGVSPPLYPDEMEEKIKEIEAKKATFVERGAADEAGAAESHQARIEERLAELDARMKEERAMQAEHAQRANRGGAGRGQRGGRGGYGQSNRGNRGGRGGRGALQRQERERPERRMSEEEADAENQEFTGTEEINEEESNKPFKAAPKKQKDFKNDEDNFPTL